MGHHISLYPSVPVQRPIPLFESLTIIIYLIFQHLSRALEITHVQSPPQHIVRSLPLRR